MGLSRRRTQPLLSALSMCCDLVACKRLPASELLSNLSIGWRALTFGDKMKRVIQIVALIAVALVITIAISLYPKFKNMGSEYATAQAIRDIEAYVQENQGQWPASPEDLQNSYPKGGEVEIDYSVRSNELIAEPGRLRDAVRPRSGQFYTYPHYDAQLDSLLGTLTETNRTNSEHGVGGQLATPPRVGN